MATPRDVVGELSRVGVFELADNGRDFSRWLCGLRQRQSQQTHVSQKMAKVGHPANHSK